MDYFKASLKLHKNAGGKLRIESKVPLQSKHDLSLAYTPGVAEPCRMIAKDPALAYDYTIKSNFVAVVTDGSAVLGLGNLGGLAGMPVMEGKCILFKRFAGIDAIPICLDTYDVDTIVHTVQHIAPTFGGINLEDISAPRCFEIERKLKQLLDIPVFHDDQHGTAVVTLAGLMNAVKVVKKDIRKVKIVLNGAGAAGIGITRLLLSYGITNIILCDSQGAIYTKRQGLNLEKESIAEVTNKQRYCGSLAKVMKGADVFIGISSACLVTKAMVSSMNTDGIVFAMANPTPEIMPDEALSAGARIVATGRSDFPNQINNVLAFPGIFRGVLDSRASTITENMLLAASKALADFVRTPRENYIIPHVFSRGVAERVANAVKSTQERFLPKKLKS